MFYEKTKVCCLIKNEREQRSNDITTRSIVFVLTQRKF